MKRKILIVEDEEPARIGLAMLLEHAGYRTMTAGTVPAALEAMRSDQPDLLIVDVRVEGYNGLQVIATSPAPIQAIVLTGFADAALEADARRLGAEFLLKPVDPDALRSLVLRLLPQHDGAPASSYARRWRRRSITSDVPIRVEGAAARVLDVSYGGAGIEVALDAGSVPPAMLQVTFEPGFVSVPLQVIWTKRKDPTTWRCGATIPETEESRWRAVVDALS